MAILTRRPGATDNRTSEQILEAIRKYSQRITITTETVLGINQGDGSALAPDTTILFGTEPPLPVGPVSIPGDSPFVANALHVHEGLHSIAAGGLPIVGNALLLPGTGIRLDQNQQSIIISATGAGGASASAAVHYVEYFPLLAISNPTLTLAFPPIDDVAIYLDGLRKTRNIHYTIANQTLAILPTLPFKDGDRIIADYFYNPVQIGVVPADFHHVVEYYALLAATSPSFTLLYTPTDEVAVYLDGFRKFKNVDYGQSGRQISMLLPFKDGDRLIFDYMWKPDASDAVPVSSSSAQYLVTLGV